MLKEEYSFIGELYKNEGVNSLLDLETNEKLRLRIDEFTSHLLNSNYPYDTLCWALAELQLIFEKGHKNYSESEVIEMEKKIFDTTLEYEDICWYIASLKGYLEENCLYP
jgi:hypothetical protein